jgi:hypothetical protein
MSIPTIDFYKPKKLLESDDIIQLCEAFKDQTSNPSKKMVKHNVNMLCADAEAGVPPEKLKNRMNQSIDQLKNSIQIEKQMIEVLEEYKEEIN